MTSKIDKVAAGAPSMAPKTPSSNSSRTSSSASTQKAASSADKNTSAKTLKALFLAKKKLVLPSDKKTCKVDSSPSPADVKFDSFPKMKKVAVIKKHHDVELANQIKLDMKSALKDRTNVESIGSIQSYKPTDQSDAAMSVRGDNKPNVYVDDVLAGTTDVYRRRESNFMSDRTKSYCIIGCITILLSIGLITLIVTIIVVWSSASMTAGDDSPSAYTKTLTISNRSGKTAPKSSENFGSF